MQSYVEDCDNGDTRDDHTVEQREDRDGCRQKREIGGGQKQPDVDARVGGGVHACQWLPQRAGAMGAVVGVALRSGRNSLNADTFRCITQPLLNSIIAIYMNIVGLSNYSMRIRPFVAQRCASVLGCFMQSYAEQLTQLDPNGDW